MRVPGNGRAAGRDGEGEIKGDVRLAGWNRIRLPEMG